MAEADPYARIEMALDRIDAALKRPEPALENLKLRHARLRERVEDAVAALDLLAAPLPVANDDFDDEEVEGDAS